MRIRIFGQGPLAEALGGLAQRAGHIVQVAENALATPADGHSFDLMILTDSGRAVEAQLASGSADGLRGQIIVDAITSAQTDLNEYFREARLVRAFASVPAHAFAELLDHASSGLEPRLAVPFAGDDRDAKAVVATFMRDIGVEPFDLGALAAADAIAPGGPLWGKALSQIELLEAEGWLSGDG